MKGIEKNLRSSPSFLDYPEKKRLGLERSIRYKRSKNEPLNDEEKNFYNANMEFFSSEEDNPAYGHRR